MTLIPKTKWEEVKQMSTLYKQILNLLEEVTKTQVWRWLTNIPSIYKAEMVYKFGRG
jgi:hypothetical protein